MADKFTKEVRSKIMAAIKSKNTSPEIEVRRLLHSAGYRYRLHNNKMPGRPDIIMPKYRAIIFIHGCYWHGHSCSISHVSKSNIEYWSSKITRNIERDKKNINILLGLGWRVLVIRECAIRGKKMIQPNNLFKNIEKWLLGSNTIHFIQS